MLRLLSAMQSVKKAGFSQKCAIVCFIVVGRLGPCTVPGENVRQCTHRFFGSGIYILPCIAAFQHCDPRAWHMDMARVGTKE